VGGHYQTNLGSSWRQRNGEAVVQGTRHATFRMGAHLIRRTCKRLLDDLQIQETVVTTPRNYPEASSQDIDEWSGVAVEAIETQQHRREGKRKLCRVAGDDLESPKQFSSVIPIARSPPTCRETDAYAPGAGQCACVSLPPICAPDSPARTPDRNGDEGREATPTVAAPVGGWLVGSRPHRRRARVRPSGQTGRRGKQTACGLAGPRERAYAELPS
jgi:hypothetical protein